MSVLPNFLVIGAMKAGTTSLYYYLRGHPQIFLPRTKEPHFFVEELNWDRGLVWYEQLFKDAGGAVAVGEASATYTLYPYFSGVPARISEVLPEVQLIFLVRHPVERMRSQYWQLVSERRETETSIDKALSVNPSPYLDGSRYAMQIEQYLEYFPLERMLILKSEDLREQRETTLVRIFAFLGVEASWMPEDLEQEWNRGDQFQRKRRVDSVLRRAPAYALLAGLTPRPLKRLKHRLVTEKLGSAPTISDSVKRELEDRLGEDVRRLRGYMTPDFDGWGIA